MSVAAPGAFVNATNHFVRSNFCNINFEWIATTLNPYYEQIDFDAFVLDDQFISDSHCFRNWFFASHNTGDMLDENFSNDLRSHVCNTFKSNDCNLFDCVSADGAFNCLNDPERQEEMVFKLIFKEIMVATQFLKNKGAMVIKFFTAFSCETISLLWFVCNCFQEVTCYKPVASKHGNSEMYLVCLKFNRNVYQSLIPRLSNLTAEEFILSRHIIGEEFINQISELCKQMTENQMKAINANVKHFQKFTSDQMKEITRKKYTVGEQFIQKFNLFSIPLSEQLVFGDRYRKTFSKRFCSLFNNYQHHKSTSTFCNQLACVLSELELDSSPHVVTTQKRNHLKLTPSYGQPFEHINNSKFCCLYVLRSFIIANSHVPFTSHVTETELFFNVLSSVIRKDFPIIFYQKSTLYDLFEQHWTKLHSVEVHCRRLTQSDSSTIFHNSPVIHIFDLYDSTFSITSNDFKLCTTLRDNFATLLHSQQLKLNDSLIIRFKILLSRLSVSLVYLLSKSFRKLTISPHSTPADSIHPSMILIMSDYCHLPPHLMCLFSGEHSPHLWTTNLLELVPVPDIVADQSFYDGLFNANCVAILECIKQQLVDSGKEEE